MSRPRFHTPIVLLALSLCALAGCSDNASSGTEGVENPNNNPESAGITISSPEEGAMVLTSPLTVEGSAQGLSQITVNGLSVPVESGAWSVEVPLAEGLVAITAQGERAETQSVTVTVDLRPPFIDLEAPTRGQFQVLGEDDRLLVRGRVVDPGAGVDGLTLNGEPVDLRGDGSFEVVSAPEIGLNVVNLAATDKAGRTGRALRGVVYGEFVPWEQPSSDAIEALVDPSALPVVEAAALGLLESGIIDELLAGNLPQTDAFQILGIEYDNADVSLTALDGRLGAIARLNGLRVNVQIGDGGAIGSVSADPAELSGEIYVSLTDSGSIETRFQRVEVELRNFALDFEDPLPGGLDNALEVVLESVAENAMTELLGRFVIDELFDPSFLSQELNLLGIVLPFEIQLNSLEVSTRGMEMRGDVDMPLEPADFVPDSPGVLRTPSAPPSGRPQKMVRLSMADDLLNKVLGQAWRGGALHLEVRELLGDGGALPIELAVGSLALLVGNELKEQAPADTPVDVELRPLLPPIVTALAGSDRHMRLQLADLMLDLFLAPEGGPREKWATLAMVLTLDIGLSLNDEGAISLDFDVEAIAQLDDEPLFDLDDEKVETVIKSLFESLPAILGPSGLDGIFDLGSLDFFGIRFSDVDVHADGADGDYISIEVDLSPGEPEMP